MLVVLETSKAMAAFNQSDRPYDRKWSISHESKIGHIYDVTDEITLCQAQRNQTYLVQNALNFEAPKRREATLWCALHPNKSLWSKTKGVAW
jgi:hypothetical protein